MPFRFYGAPCIDIDCRERQWNTAGLISIFIEDTCNCVIMLVPVYTGINGLILHSMQASQSCKGQFENNDFDECIVYTKQTKAVCHCLEVMICSMAGGGGGGGLRLVIYMATTGFNQPI